MYLIKCFGFLKSLKQLFIILLISFFGLLANSFVSATDGYVRQIGTIGYSPYNSGVNLVVLNKGSFLSQSFGVGKALFFMDSDLYFAWILNPRYGTNGLYIHSKYSQGFATKYYNCDEIIDDGLNILQPSPGNCHVVNITTGTVDIIGSFLSSVNSSDYFWFFGEVGSSYSRNSHGLCISSSLYHQSICFGGCYYPQSLCSFIYGADNGYNVSDSLNLPGDYASINDYILLPSPSIDLGVGGDIDVDQNFIGSTGTSLNGFLVVNSGYTNSDMIKGYECVGLQSSLCYGGFDIDNIFDPSEQFEDFTGYKAGQGATVFQLYNLYSGSFSSLNQFLNTVLTRYQNGQINSFKTEPKALLMLGAQMNTAGFSSSYVANYCNLLLNENNNNYYSGNSVEDLRAQSCLRTQKVGSSFKTGSLDIGFQSTNLGIFSGNDFDFDPDTFFSNVMNKLDTFLNQNLITGNVVGIVPGYIVVALLGLIFIRLISH